MDKFLHILLHTLKHSAILLPFLLLAYVLIEVLEYYSMSKLQHSKLLSNRWSTLFGAGFGLVPQCGFSVVATDLFAQKKIKIGTLLAVYIATSDEAIPLLLSSPNSIKALLPLLLVKFFVAVLIGYLIDLIFKKFNNNNIINQTQNLNTTNNELTHEETDHDHEHHSNNTIHEHEQENNEEHTENISTGCCGHHLSEENTKHAKLKRFLIHPLIHTLKIFAFIFIINLIFNGLLEWLGEDKIANFLLNSKGFAPLVSALIGLIPNCASSVVITNLYSIGGIGFGALVAGLIVNAGIAFVILFKENKNIKQNFLILGTMLLIGISVGYIIQLIGF